MTTYKDTLARYLSGEGRTQAALAEAAITTQPSIARYAAGTRFPDRATAERIDAATIGEVPFALWQAEMAARLGIPTPGEQGIAA